MEAISQKPEIYNFHCWIIESDIQLLNQVGEKALQNASFQILNHIEQAFPNGGNTALWLLGESHLALHLFMPEGKAYFELASCNKDKAKKFIAYIRNQFPNGEIQSQMESFCSAT